MKRVYNFSAGPATLPVPVLEQAANEMLNYAGSGVSVLEMSHRSPEFEAIITRAEEDLRELAGIPDHYRVLFLQGGASLQFAMAPLNLMQKRKADYIITGSWSQKAAAEAGLYGDVRILASSEPTNYAIFPDLSQLEVREDADYVYICGNETIHGVRYPALPDTQGKPLVADLSSSFLSEPLVIEDYGVIIAGAQKNFGPAGVVLVIIREDLIRDEVLPATPTMLRYSTHAAAASLYNTPPAYSIYICGLVFRWLLELGGLEAMQAINEAKAKRLYDALDASRLFRATVTGEARSSMNVPFVSDRPELDPLFLEEAATRGLVQLQGHRNVGGMRASVYNAMPPEGVDALIDCLQDFESQHQGVAL